MRLKKKMRDTSIKMDGKKIKEETNLEKIATWITHIIAEAPARVKPMHSILDTILISTRSINTTTTTTARKTPTRVILTMIKTTTKMIENDCMTLSGQIRKNELSILMEVITSIQDTCT
uniref:Uncharacterized protein n=1 Tax=Cacopsylla melanoneura TaxID=428564 RepID=A0A8D8UP27_9HEMI